MNFFGRAYPLGIGYLIVSGLKLANAQTDSLAVRTFTMKQGSPESIVPVFTHYAICESLFTVNYRHLVSILGEAAWG